MSLFINTSDKESLEQIIKANIERAKQVREKIASLTSNEIIEETKKENVKEKEIKEEIIETSESIIREEEFEYYYENMRSALQECKTREEKVNAIYDNLPIVENKDYENIIHRIVLELLYEKNEYNSLKEEEDEETIKQLEEEIKDIDETIEIVKDHINYEEKTSTKEKKVVKNKILFFRTGTNTIYAESDLDSISSETYPDFKELLLSLENGTFKGVKKLSGNDHIVQGTPELKLYQARVIFDRIDADKYIVVYAFVKKNTCDVGYLDQLKRRLKYYRAVKKEYIANLTEEQVLEDQEVFKRIIEGLDNKAVVKTKK